MGGRRDRRRIGRSSGRGIVTIVIASIALMRICRSAGTRAWMMWSRLVSVSCLPYSPVPFFLSACLSVLLPWLGTRVGVVVLVNREKGRSSLSWGGVIHTESRLTSRNRTFRARFPQGRSGSIPLHRRHCIAARLGGCETLAGEVDRGPYALSFFLPFFSAFPSTFSPFPALASAFTRKSILSCAP